MPAAVPDLSDSRSDDADADMQDSTVDNSRTGSECLHCITLHVTYVCGEDVLALYTCQTPQSRHCGN